MLNDYRQLYEDYANTYLTGWKTANKNDLCEHYVTEKEKNSKLADAYLSAIIVRYWSLIESWYNSQMYKFATEEDCYEHVIEGLLYSLDRHVWRDPTNSLYEDKNGPDKSINVHQKTTKLTFYQGTNKDIRKLNYAVLSLDYLSENASDDFYVEDTSYDDDFQTFENYVMKYIRNKFLNKETFLAFVIDAIINNDVFAIDQKDINQPLLFSPRKLTSHMKSLSTEYFKVFAGRYNIPIDLVKVEADKIRVLTYRELSDKIRLSLVSMTYDRDFMRWLKGC